jgi:hypothetical protein
MGRDIVFNFLVIRAADGAWTEGYHFSYVLHGSRGIENRRRTDIGRECKFGGKPGCLGRRLSLRFHWSGIPVLVASYEGNGDRQQQYSKRDSLVYQFPACH